MITTFFGLPGSGKTTILCAIAKNASQYSYVFSNVYTPLCFYLDTSDILSLGEWSVPENSLILIDEAGIDMNNRGYKNFPQNFIKYLKLHRHYKVDFVFFSQAYNDFDITIRRLCNIYWRVKSVGPFSFVRQIVPILSIDEEDHQIVDGYRFSSMISRLFHGRLYSLIMRFFRIRVFSFFEFPWYFVFRPKYYKYFDSWSRPDTPVRFIGQ